MKLVILRTGDAAAPVAARHGEFGDWIRREMAPVWGGGWGEVDVRTDAPVSMEGVAGFVITGSSASVTERAPWMLRLEAFLRDVVAAEVPLFGICFGHQIVAQALGGHVAQNPRGREIGTVEITRSASHPIFEGLPERFVANATHIDTVAKLPPGAEVLASSRLEPTQAFVLGKSVACVQFHPEFDGPVMRSYVEARSDRILAEGGDPAALHAEAKDAPFAAETLRNFVRSMVRTSA